MLLCHPGHSSIKFPTNEKNLLDSVTVFRGSNDGTGVQSYFIASRII